MTINAKAKIPLGDPSFQRFLEAFVFNCPSAMVVSKKKSKVKEWNNVSSRESSFRTRKITGTLLNTITSQIKRLLKNNLYQKVESTQEVDKIFDASSASEKIVFRAHSQMSDSEAVFYYIRNSFAHGSFEVVATAGGEKIYKMESKKNDVIKAQMMLKESTLLKLVDISNYTRNDVESLQKKKVP